MNKSKLVSLVLSIIIPITITITGLNMKALAADNLCHKAGDHANVWKLLSYDGMEHTFCWHCDICNIDYVGAPGQEFDTRETSRHYSANQTVTAVDDKCHRYSGTCDECHQTINYSEDHSFNDSEICTICKYNKNNTDGNSGSGSNETSGGSGGSSGEAGGSGSGGAGGTEGGENGGNGGNGGSGGSGGGETGGVVEEKIAQIPEGLTLVYNKKKQTGVLEGTGYTVTGNRQKNAGSYKATAKLEKDYKWSDGTTESKTIKWKIEKAKNPGVLKFRKNPSVSYKKLKKGRQTIKSSKLFKLSKAVGKVSYSMEKANVKIGINRKTGDLVIKKGLPKGTYNVTVKASAAGDKNYKKGSATVTLKLTVK